MKTRLILTGLILAVSAATLTGCVVYPAPVAVEPSVTVHPSASYYYGPRYHYYSHRDW